MFLFYFFLFGKSADGDEVQMNTFSPTGQKQIGENTFWYWKKSDIPAATDDSGEVRDDPQQCYLSQERHCASTQSFALPFVAGASQPAFVRGRYFQDSNNNMIRYYAHSSEWNAAHPGPEYENDRGLCSNLIRTSFEHRPSASYTQLNNVCPMFRDHQTCCLSTSQQYTNNRGALSHTAIAEAQDSRKSALYPRCDDLIRPFFCIMCHPNKKYMTTEVYAQETNTDAAITYYDVRVCHSFARKLYKECRYATSVGNVNYGYNWIVEPGMGYDDFLKKLHIEFLNNESDPETLDELGVNCWDYSAGFISSRASTILFSFVAIVSFIYAFF